MTWKRRNEKTIIGLRQMAGRSQPPTTLNTNKAPSIELRDMPTPHTPMTPGALPPQLGGCHRCGCVECGGEGCEVKVEVEVKLPRSCSRKQLSENPVNPTSAPTTQPGYYNQQPHPQGNRTDSVAVSGNAAYGRGTVQAPPPPPNAPPPPYPGGSSSVSSIPEYDYIVNRT